MDIIERSYRELFPEREFNYSTRLRYSAAFNDFNANIRFHKHKALIVVSLSRRWQEVSEDIVIGLVQELLMKLFGKGEKRRTLQMDLYHIYLKNTHITAEKDKIDSRLLQSFRRVNSKYFDDSIEQTNLVWGQRSMRTLGRYEYGSDTIMISSVFKDAPEIFIDKIMHHEMLHKKHKYDVKAGRCTHHTRAFREEERTFEDFDKIEKEIGRFISMRRIQDKSQMRKRRRGILGWFNGA